jgi:hypothetical protein
MRNDSGSMSGSIDPDRQYEQLSNSLDSALNTDHGDTREQLLARALGRVALLRTTEETEKTPDPLERHLVAAMAEEADERRYHIRQAAQYVEVLPTDTHTDQQRVH